MKSIKLFCSLALISTTAAAAPETYVLDANHTLPRFSYNHMGYSIQESRFDKASGKIVLDRDAGTGSVEVSVDTRSVDTGSPQFNEHIQAADFLDTAQYPAMTFKSSQLHFQDGQLTAVDGTLTLKGISRPVTLTVSSFHCMLHPMYKKEACGANASTVLKRSDFNMGKYAPLVGDEVTVTLPVEATRE